MPEGAVGDVNSDAKGSGARYNAGKAPLELIPLSILAESFSTETTNLIAYGMLSFLGLWQETGDTKYLYKALTLARHYWRDAAKVFDYGRKKYKEWNWAKGMAWSIPLACAARHLLSAMEFENLDPESGESHIAHAICNIVMLIQFTKTYPEGDDRPRCLG